MVKKLMKQNQRVSERSVSRILQKHNNEPVDSQAKNACEEEVSTTHIDASESHDSGKYIASDNPLTQWEMARHVGVSQTVMWLEKIWTAARRKSRSIISLSAPSCNAKKELCILVSKKMVSSQYEYILTMDDATGWTEWAAKHFLSIKKTWKATKRRHDSETRLAPGADVRHRFQLTRPNSSLHIRYQGWSEYSTFDSRHLKPNDARGRSWTIRGRCRRGDPPHGQRPSSCNKTSQRTQRAWNQFYSKEWMVGEFPELAPIDFFANGYLEG